MGTPDPSTDCAIIVGIERYLDSGLGGLGGAKRDARRFYDWLTSAGGVPPARVIFLPAPDAALDPTIQEIDDAFVSLCAPAKATWRLGRRLYIYLSGHGVAQNWHEASLLAADGGP